MATREPTKEEFEALSRDLQEVLIKHNAEIGVKSTIELMIRLEEAKPEEGIPTPFLVKDDGEPGDKTEGAQA